MKPTEVLARSLMERHPEDAARALEGIDAQDAAKLLKKLPAKLVNPVLERLRPDAAAGTLTHLGADQTRQLLEAMPARQAATIMQNLDEAIRESALAGMKADPAAKLRSLLTYPEETVGGIMDPHVTSFPTEIKVKDAIARLRKAPRQTLYYLYVTDRERKLVGVLLMRDLLLAQSNEPIEPLIKRDVVSAKASMSHEQVAAIMRERKYLALPVVDDDGHLLGIVRSDKVLGVTQEEAFQDLQKMAGAGEDERALSPVTTVVKRRLPWLYVNLLTAFVAASVIGVFEGIIEKVTALAILLPIVAGQGGNTGAQSLAIVMRGLALRELLPGSLKRLLFKEFMGGLLNGVAIAVATAGAVYLWDGRWALSMVIGLAMIVNMSMAALAGASIPLVLRALKRDPAQSASIFMTTVTDVVGFAAFLGFAVLFQNLLL